MIETIIIIIRTKTFTSKLVKRYHKIHTTNTNRKIENIKDNCNFHNILEFFYKLLYEQTKYILFFLRLRKILEKYNIVSPDIIKLQNVLTKVEKIKTIFLKKTF